ncbi:hypothetical protein B0H14DRAFT_2593399 [Mycena olivaceomarginata]|nr:hypothetical protein B0H14DRAFT_2593399 [Mycena olivaceomarginata]
MQPHLHYGLTLKLISAFSSMPFLISQLQVAVTFMLVPGTDRHLPVSPPGNQTNAIQVLISVINLRNETLSTSTIPSTPVPSSSSGPTHSTEPSLRKASKIGPIVGGTLGGLLLLAGVVLGIVLLRRRTQNPPRSVVSVFSTAEAVSSINPYPISVQSINPPSPSLPRPRKGDPRQNLASPQESTSNSHEVMSMASRLPTDELVTLLYRRIHNAEFRGGEHPPDYPVTEVGPLG